MRIQTKQRRQGIRRQPFLHTILLPHSIDQIRKRLKGQPVRPELYMPRFVSRHHQIQTYILFCGRVATEESRQ